MFETLLLGYKLILFILSFPIIGCGSIGFFLLSCLHQSFGSALVHGAHASATGRNSLLLSTLLMCSVARGYNVTCGLHLTYFGIMIKQEADSLCGLRSLVPVISRCSLSERIKFFGFIYDLGRCQKSRLSYHALLLLFWSVFAIEGINLSICNILKVVSRLHIPKFLL